MRNRLLEETGKICKKIVKNCQSVQAAQKFSSTDVMTFIQ